jgi:predicted Zn-dependent protease
MSLLGKMKRMLGKSPKKAAAPKKSAKKKAAIPAKRPTTSKKSSGSAKKIVKKTIHKPAKAMKKATKKIVNKTTKKIVKKSATKQSKTIKHPKTHTKTKLNTHSKSRTKLSHKPPHSSAHKQSQKKGKTTKPTKRQRKPTDIDYVQQFQQQTEPQPVEKKIVKYPVLSGGDNDRVKMLLPILRELIKKGAISDWLINFSHVRSSNIYIQRNFEIEDELSSVREDLILTIYERFDDGMMGEARIPIITLDPAEAKTQILDAKAISANARKPQFDLPEPREGIELPRGHDERLLAMIFEGNGAQATRTIHTRIRATMQPIQDVKLSCAEVLASASTVRVISSTGVDISFHKTNIYLEAVLTCRSGKPGEKGVEREFGFNRITVSPEQLDIQGVFLQQTQIARDATAAEPNPGFTGDVLLSGNSVTEFFAPHHDLNPLVLHTSAKLHHMGLSSFRIGQPIGQFTSGEPITITTNPSLPLGLYTMPVDEEGTPLQPAELVRNGLFASYIATARYAQYLGVPVTGNISNIQVNPGATREEHLRGNGYIEIVAFSWFNPNPLSGDFAAEIRLAYKWVNGRKTPIRGGTFTGNVFTNILAARFSKEIMQSGAYYGPRAVLFKNAVVNKFE